MKHVEHHVMYMHAVPSFCVEHRNTIEVELIKIFFPATACKQSYNVSPVIILCVCTTGMAQPGLKVCHWYSASVLLMVLSPC